MATQRWVAPAPQTFAGRVVGNGHCVPFVQAASGIGHTSTWKRGELVRGGEWQPGTVIATFHPTQHHYENDTSGRSHAAILIAAQSDGLLVWDAWVGQPVHQRVIRYRGATGDNHVNDADRFYIVTTMVATEA